MSFHNLTPNELTKKQSLKQDKFQNDYSLLNPRVFLQTALQNHKSFHNIDNWSEMIKYSIKEEYSSKSGLYSNNPLNINISSIAQNDNNESKNEMLKNIAFGQLISFSYNMITFGFNKTQVNELIDEICNTHDIPDEMKEQIFMKIEECSEEIQQTIIKSIFNENIISQISNEDFKSYVSVLKTSDDIKILPESILHSEEKAKLRNSMSNQSINFIFSSQKEDKISTRPFNENDEVQEED